MILSPFEHKFIRVHQNYFANVSSASGPERCFFLGVSGGVDSMVLLYLFHKFKNQLKCNFRVCYVHHGISTESSVSTFRDDSLKCVRDFCFKNEIEFVTNNVAPSTELVSEQSLRAFRYEQFNHLKSDFEILVLAHHLDDLLETKIMDLIRGSHFETWENHKEYSGQIFRPLSLVSKKDIYDFAAQINMIGNASLKNTSDSESRGTPIRSTNSFTWVEDPSNQDADTLRNWIRNEFLQELQNKSPSYKENLMKNLIKLYEYQPVSKDVAVLEVPLTEWMTYTMAEKKQFVLKSGIHLGLKSMTQGQILDILKKLDLGQKDIKFQTGPIFWTKTADRLHAYRRSHEE